MKVVSVGEMRRLEAESERRGLPGSALMEIAGRAFADAVAERRAPLAGRKPVVLVGPGNNGGDGLVAARWLRAFGAHPVVLTVGRRPAADAKLDLLGAAGVPLLAPTDAWPDEALEAPFAGADLVVDALLGIGRVRPIDGLMKRVLEAAARVGAPIVGLDVPSGLDADTGTADPATPRCAETITLGAVKRGLVIGDGPRLAGEIVPVEIGIPPGLAADVAVDWIDGRLARRLLPERDPTGHKGSFGRVLVVAGSPRYVGAPLLAALGAARAGAGLVTLAAPGDVARAVAGRLPEATFLPLPGADEAIAPAALAKLEEVAGEYRALVLGPGLGRADGTARFLEAALASPALREGPGWVIDADALTLLSRMERWPSKLPPEAVLTPHPGEMARLLGAERIPTDRIAAATESARRWRAVVVLKGAYTVVATPDGRCAVNPAANPALATAGTGDVLAGAIGGLIGQGAAPGDAALAGVAVHGAAGALVRRAFGRGGALASDVADRLPEAAEALRTGREPGR
ncbi:MAG TPA: NAD(P)H-hydrate dehydratase [Chloroflexota bacterium]|nr:NAD(P)H-hydrate dehydratase [Chloroflexota bacterium]